MLTSSRINFIARASAVLAFAAPVWAQKFNVDVGDLFFFPLPAPSYAAAASQAGTWNNINPNPAAPVQLTDITGALTSVTIATSAGTGLAFPNGSVTGDDAKLLNDGQNTGPSTSWTFSGLSNGAYRVYTYAWAPDNNNYRTNVSVPGSANPAQLVGGAWTGAHVQGVTYALHNVNVASGTIVVNATIGVTAGTIDGFQIVKDTVVNNGPFCFGDSSEPGVIGCPCGNAGSAGHGCANSVTFGALLTFAGQTQPDSIVLSASEMPDTASAIYLQGNALVANGAVFGDGVRCAGGSLVRLALKNSVGGASSYPQGGDPKVSVNGSVISGSTYYYQTYYRNPASFCTVDTFNVTNGIRLTW